MVELGLIPDIDIDTDTHTHIHTHTHTYIGLSRLCVRLVEGALIGREHIRTRTLHKKVTATTLMVKSALQLQINRYD